MKIRTKIFWVLCLLGWISFNYSMEDECYSMEDLFKAAKIGDKATIEKLESK